MKPYHLMTKEEKKELARKEIIRVAQIVGKSPTKNDYKSIHDTKISYGQIVYLYKKWNLAIRDAGLKQNRTPLAASHRASKLELIEPFIEVANKVGKMPTYREFCQFYTIPLSLFIKYFGSWNDTKLYIYTKYRDRLTFLPPRVTAKRHRRTKAEIEAERKKGTPPPA